MNLGLQIKILLTFSRYQDETSNLKLTFDR